MSSLIRLFTNPLDAKSLIEYDIEPGTVLIDWLQDEYPEGFGSLVRVFIGKDEIDLDDLDYEVGDLEQITILVMPGDPGFGAAMAAAWANYGGWTALAIQAAVGIGIGVAMSLLFPPKKMGGDDGGEDPVYTLNTNTNKARLGQPIPSHYGTVRFPPDVAAQPVSFYSHNGESNEHFIDGLYCLGQGKFDVENMEVYVGDTPISQLEKGSAFYYITGAGGHNRTMGAFSEIINRKLANTAYPYPFRENVYTSPEVEQFIFSESGSETTSTGGSLVSPTSEAISFLVEGPDIDHKYYSAQLINIPVNLEDGEAGESVPTPNVSAGDDIIITGTANNNGTFPVTAVILNEDDPTLMTIYIKDTIWIFNHIENEVLTSGSYTIDKSQSNMSAGPFRAQKEGQIINEVECDIIFPQGIYRISSSGNSRKRTVTWELTVTEIDPETGAAIAAPITSQHEITSKLRGPVRTTISSGVIPDGAYVASIRRTSNISDATDIQDQMVWSGLKGVIVPTKEWVYSYTTLLMVRLRATAGIASAARQRITVKAKRLLENDTVDSSDPIEVLRDIWTSKRYGLGRPSSELDEAALDTLSAHWAANDVHFNGSFATKGEGWAALSNAVAFTGSRVVQNGGLVTVIPDQIKPIRTAMFSSANMTNFSVVYNWDTQGSYDSIQCEYRNPDTFEPEFVYLFPDGQVDGLGVDSFSPDTYNCFGSTSKEYTEQYAQYMSNIKNRRRKTVSFSTELEGLIPVFGDRVLVSHPMTDLVQSGVLVEQISALTWRVDQSLEWGNSNVIILRDSMGVPSGPLMVTQGDAANIVVFEASPLIATDSQSVEPTSYLFGSTYQVSKDYLVNSIKPSGDNMVTITAQPYDEAIYDGAPPQMSNI